MIILYYYPPPCLQAPRACLIPCQILQAFEEEGGRRPSSLWATTPHFKFLGIPRSNLFLCFACTITFDKSFQPKLSKRLPNGAPEILKNSKSLAKVGSKFKPRNQAWKTEVQSVRIVLPSTFWLHFRSSQAFQKVCQMDPKWKPKVRTNLKHFEN